MAAPITTTPAPADSSALAPPAAPPATPPPPTPPVAHPTPYRFTVEEYERMGEAGILGEDDRVELIAGEIVQMSPIGSYHANCVNRLNIALVQTLSDQAVVGIQNPIRLTHNAEPQPDIAVLRPPLEAYDSILPTAADVLLIIEVADSSLATDRGVKLPLYAQAGIPEVWIVNLTGRSIEQYTQPRNGVYETLHTAQHPDSITAAILPGLTLQVRDIIV